MERCSGLSFELCNKYATGKTRRGIQRGMDKESLLKEGVQMTMMRIAAIVPR
jgi:hypothetical protein